MEAKVSSFQAMFDRDLELSQLTQKHIALELGVTQQAISQWRRKNKLPKKHQQALAEVFKARLTSSSLVYACYREGRLAETQGLGVLNADARRVALDESELDIESAYSKETVSSSEKYARGIGASPSKGNTESLRRHAEWLKEITRQYSDTEINCFFASKNDIKAIFDIAIHPVSTFVQCVGQFTTEAPLREIRSYGGQLVKLSAMAQSDRQESREINRIVIINGIFGREEPNNYELSISRYLDVFGIAVLHVKSYEDAMVCISHLYHQNVSSKRSALDSNGEKN